MLALCGRTGRVHTLITRLIPAMAPPRSPSPSSNPLPFPSSTMTTSSPSSPPPSSSHPQYKGLVIPGDILSDGVRTFEYQDSVPPLPLPDLHNTMRKYLQSVLPLVDEKSYERTVKLVKEFSSGDGIKLNAQLQERHNEDPTWLASLWTDRAYVKNREPVPLGVNYIVPGSYHQGYDTTPPLVVSQSRQAAMLLYITAIYWTLLRQERIAVDKAARGLPGWSCMNQYRAFFNTSRTPGVLVDHYNRHFTTEAEGPCPSHCVVLCRGRFFVFDLKHPESGEFLHPPEIELQLEMIRSRSDEWGPGVGALTADNRPQWAQNREHLCSLDPSHVDHLRTIDSALTLLVLEEESPTDNHSLFSLGHLCDPRLRWHDKTLQQIVFRNGTFVHNVDHGVIDGFLSGRLMDIYRQTLKLNEGKWPGSNEVRELESPVELVFHVDHTILQAIHNISRTFKDQFGNMEFIYPVFSDYGKVFIKSCHFHPDAFVQMAIQLAYYRIHNKPGSVFAVATTRMYRHGRIETIRSCTMETVAWVRAMVNKDIPDIERRRLLDEAMMTYIRNMDDCSHMRCCSTHLMALKTLAEESGRDLPQFFTDPSYHISGGDDNFTLSASLLGYHSGISSLFIPLNDTYNCGYTVQPHQITFMVSTYSDKGLSAENFSQVLLQSLSDMRQFILKTQELKNSL